MEALSPRDANAGRPVPKVADMKTTKTAAQLRAAKDKDHPPPPPENVPEPPSSERPEGCVYEVGKMLGKGGFAVCYQGYMLPNRQKYALKIVKSQMPPKMQQKVSQPFNGSALSFHGFADTASSFKPSCRSTPR